MYPHIVSYPHTYSIFGLHTWKPKKKKKTKPKVTTHTPRLSNNDGA